MKKILIALFVLVNLFCANAQAGRSETEAKVLIDSLHAALLNGADFTKMAQTFSDDKGTREKGGVIMNSKKGQLVPEFEETAIRLNVGDISEPFRTQFGFHVLQLMTKAQDSFSVRHILIAVKE